MLIHLQAAPPPQPAPAASATPDSRSTSFQAVEGNQPEQHSGSTLLIEAYVVLWLILMTWLLSMWRRQAAIHSRLDDLERVVDKAAAKLAK
ncbi:MAG: CcmD family protein [Polyangiaceae bacterium]